MFESDIIVLLIVMAWFIFIFDTIMARRNCTFYNEVGKREKGTSMSGLCKNVLTLVLCGVTIAYSQLIYKVGQADGAERVTRYVEQKVQEFKNEMK